MVMFGGAGPAIQPFHIDTWTYDGTAWVRVDSTTGPAGLVHHAMAYDARRQRVVLVGGFDAENRRTTDVWEWDGTRWHRIVIDGPTPSARSHHRLAYDAARGVIVLFGGGRNTNETWTWDGTQWKQHVVDGAPPGRDSHALAYDAVRQRVVLYGGSNRQGVPPHGYLDDVWEWDGTRWSRSTPAPAP
jgi:hypothetical protein